MLRVFSAVSLLVASLLITPSRAWPATGDCAQPLTNGPSPTASDCLYMLRVALNIVDTCDPDCICAPKGTLPPTAVDALICLKKSVGQEVALNCPCPGGTTTTIGATTTTVGVTTTSIGGSTTTAGAATTTTLTSDIETQVFPKACVSVTLRPGAFTTKVKGEAAITVEIDRASIDDRDSNGREELAAEITSFLLTTSNPLLGTVVVKLPDLDVDPGQTRRALGLIEETTNTTPGVLDLPPYAGAGTGEVSFDLFIQAASASTGRLHHHVAIGLAGTVTNSPPPAGELVAMQNSENIPVLKDDETQYGTVFIDTADKATIDLGADGCE